MCAQVKAQIKLKLTSAAGKPTVVCRNFSLTQKSTKLEYKAFESALQAVNQHGEKVATSHKCTDLNRLVPELMGVSPAVLENVIFVHQEDSCWPLGEDKVLKEKFDDIFAATQYTKALDEVRKLKNAKKQEEKTASLELATLEEKLGQANKLREEVTTGEDTMSRLDEILQGHQQHIHEAESKLPALRDRLHDAHRIRNQISELNIKHQQARETLVEKKKSLEEIYDSQLTDTDEQLRSTLQTIDSYLRRQQEHYAGKEAKLAEAQRTQEENRQRMYAANGRLEAAKAQRNQHQQAEREAEVKLNQLSSKYELSVSIGANSSDTTRKVGAALDTIRAAVHSREEELKSAKTAADQKLAKLVAVKEQKSAQLAGSADEIAKKQREVKEMQKREQELTEKLNEMQGDEVRLARIRDELTRLRAEAETQTQESGSSGEAEDLKRSKAKLGELQHQFSKLMDEMTEVDAEHDKQQKRAQQKAAAEEQQAKLMRAIDEKKTRIRNVLGNPTADIWQMLEENQLVKKFNDIKRQRDAEKDSLAHDVKDMENRLAKKEAEVYAKNAELKRIEEDVGRAEEQIRAMDTSWLQEGFDFTERAREAQRDAEEMRNAASSDNAKNVIEFIDQAIVNAERKHKCGLCASVAGPDQIAHMKRKRDRWAERSSANPEEEQRKAREKDDLARKLHRADEEMRKIKKLKTVDKPASQQTMDSLRSEAQQMRAEVDSRRSDLDQQSIKEKEVQDLRGEVETLRFMHTEYARLKQEAAASQSAQSAIFGDTRTKAEVTEALQAVTAEREQTQKRVDKLEVSLRKRSEFISENAGKTNAKELELSKLHAELERRKDFEAQRDELATKRSQLFDEAARAKQQEEPLRRELNSLEGELRALRESTERDIGKIDARVTEANRDHATLQISHEGLRKYTEQGHGETLAEQQQEFERAKQAVDDGEAQQVATRKQLEECRNNLQKKEVVKLEINANLEYRVYAKQVEDYKAQVEAKQEELQQVPGNDRLQQEIKALEDQAQRSKLELAEVRGGYEQVKGKTETAKKELRDAKYRRIDDEHRQKLIEVKTVGLAVKDLDNYYKALDRALMKYHSSKMESINKSIKELWNKTYKGPDIDGIEIHSEHEGETAAGARKQSYRVVMTKGDTKLDMRGRCSAGQKVLASLVIRLALAESFCVNCGILALDEPTTNLDTANIESFALALNEIIKSRRQQSNFQLIVITHDEDFVQLVGRSENASHYFRVDKRLADGSHHNSAPHSVIDRFEIGRFG